MNINTSILVFLFTIFLVVSNTQGFKLNKKYNDPTPPPYNEFAKMARYIVHKSNWTAMGTLSTLKTLDGFPMVSIISIADSPLNSKSTGNVYFLLTVLDFVAQDLKVNNRLTMVLSMDQDFSCSSQNVDPMEPTCGRVMLSGSVVKLQPNTDELNFANQSMLSRHPASAHWVKWIHHEFFFCKLDIKQITLLDYYGGPQYIKLEDYFKANIDEYLELDENDNNVYDYNYNYKLEETNEIESYTNKKYNFNDQEINITISKNSNIRRINIF